MYQEIAVIQLVLLEQQTLLDSSVGAKNGEKKDTQTRSCWVHPWLSAEIRLLQSGHYDRSMTKLRMEDEPSAELMIWISSVRIFIMKSENPVHTW